MHNRGPLAWLGRTSQVGVMGSAADARERSSSDGRKRGRRYVGEALSLTEWAFRQNERSLAGGCGRVQAAGSRTPRLLCMRRSSQRRKGPMLQARYTKPVANADPLALGKERAATRATARSSHAPRLRPAPGRPHPARGCTRPTAKGGQAGLRPFCQSEIPIPRTARSTPGRRGPTLPPAQPNPSAGATARPHTLAFARASSSWAGRGQVTAGHFRFNAISSGWEGARHDVVPPDATRQAARMTLACSCSLPAALARRAAA